MAIGDDDMGAGLVLEEEEEGPSSEPAVDGPSPAPSLQTEVEGKVDDLNLDASSEAGKKKKKKSKSKKKKELPTQTDPPSIPVIELFPSGEFPEGEIQQYKDERPRPDIQFHILQLLGCEGHSGGILSATGF